MAQAKLARYRAMRDFSKTPEPTGDTGDRRSGRRAGKGALRFVIQKHDARRLHFDLRLEYAGRFRSWAVPKGPSLDPHDRRLAMEVEDHPLEYGDFEGTIPQGEYGGGTVMLWDRGFWRPEPGFEDVGAALSAGELKFTLDGERLRGSWVLIRTRRDQRGRASWLLIKHRDAAAAEDCADLATDADRSVASGRVMAQIAAGEGAAPRPFMTARAMPRGAVWHSAKPASENAAPQKPAPSRPRPASRQAATIAAAALPDFIAPQLASAAAHPPAGAEWLHEIKFDGYRMQLRVQGGEAKLLTRTGLDWSKRFPEIRGAGAMLADGIYDGEIVGLDAEGRPDFGALQLALADHKTGALILFLFDQLYDGCEDLRARPLHERKAVLADRLAGAESRLRYVDHFTTAGDAVLRSACRLHLEGVVSKDRGAPYRSGRTESWRKAKCRAGHEVVIGGYTTTGRRFRSLIAGLYKDGVLIEVGRIGTGFAAATRERLMPRLEALATPKSPFATKPARRGGGLVHWVRPELVAEIEYEGFTPDGLLRQAAFKGLREDKPATEVTAAEPRTAAPHAAGPPEPRSAKPAKPAAKAREGDKARGSAESGRQAAGGSAKADQVMGLRLSHPDKLLWPEAGPEPGITKRDLADYYEAIGPWMIAHLAGRPCSMLRAPEGIGGQLFFQRHAGRGQSPLITAVTVWGDRKPYLRFDRPEALIAAAQIDALELHPWNCRPDAPEEPGRLVFDLDPAPDVPFAEVVSAAQEFRSRLADLGLIGFCKTTGGKGLHVVVPIQAEGLDWAFAKAFARGLCQQIAADAPRRYLITMSKAARQGRIFLDYLRNDRMATAVAPLSPRARPGAPVSMPLTWAQVTRRLNPARFTLRAAPALLARSKPWQGYEAAARPLAEAAARLGP